MKKVEIQIKKGLVNDYVTIGNTGRFYGIGKNVEEAVNKAIEECKNFNLDYIVQDYRR